MAQNEEHGNSQTNASSHPSPNEPKESPARPDSSSPPDNGQKTQARNSSAFSHPGARAIAQRAADGDGPYRCRKCGAAILTVSVLYCPACLDNHPWFAPADNRG